MNSQLPLKHYEEIKRDKYSHGCEISICACGIIAIHVYFSRISESSDYAFTLSRQKFFDLSSHHICYKGLATRCRKTFISAKNMPVLFLAGK